MPANLDVGNVRNLNQEISSQNQSGIKPVNLANPVITPCGIETDLGEGNIDFKGIV